MPPTHIHRQATRDLIHLLERFGTSSEQVQERYNLRLKLCDIFTSEPDLGDRFDVQDVSMHTYAADISPAPMEFVLVDRQHSDTLPPETKATELPSLYDSSRVASLLRSAGFDGVLHSVATDRRGQEFKTTSRGRIARDNGLPWPKDAVMSQAEEIAYPIVFIARSPVRFHLSMPAPALSRTIGFLRAQKAIGPHVPSLFAALYIWIRSWGVQELSPVALYLLFIRFLQV
ncbi:hypothetical protein FA95DRAFT_237241 [Auriscalpium vulgare]|uniref:Uncharacterized protein n=1 Tax=Auriscalpium vulgare TaxID=40419 RepID=A0ACB8S655_9AGAM|nr:hypothetical protein FA95DRAFT_237241 [Auriscalpium vulgare]